MEYSCARIGVVICETAAGLLVKDLMNTRQGESSKRAGVQLGDRVVNVTFGSSGHKLENPCSVQDVKAADDVTHPHQCFTMGFSKHLPDLPELQHMRFRCDLFPITAEYLEEKLLAHEEYLVNLRSMYYDLHPSTEPGTDTEHHIPITRIRKLLDIHEATLVANACMTWLLLKMENLKNSAAETASPAIGHHTTAVEHTSVMEGQDVRVSMASNGPDTVSRVTSSLGSAPTPEPTPITTSNTNPPTANFNYNPNPTTHPTPTLKAVFTNEHTSRTHPYTRTHRHILPSPNPTPDPNPTYRQTYNIYANQDTYPNARATPISNPHTNIPTYSQPLANLTSYLHAPTVATNVPIRANIHTASLPTHPHTYQSTNIRSSDTPISTNPHTYPSRRVVRPRRMRMSRRRKPIVCYAEINSDDSDLESKVSDEEPAETVQQNYQPRIGPMCQVDDAGLPACSTAPYTEADQGISELKWAPPDQNTHAHTLTGTADATTDDDVARFLAETNLPVYLHDRALATLKSFAYNTESAKAALLNLSNTYAYDPTTPHSLTPAQERQFRDLMQKHWKDFHKIHALMSRNDGEVCMKQLVAYYYLVFKHAFDYKHMKKLAAKRKRAE